MRRSVAVPVCMLMLAGCEPATETVTTPRAAVTLTVRNLPEPDPGGHYALWASFYDFSRKGGGGAPLHEGGYRCLGRFVVGEDGSSLRDTARGAARFSIPADEDPALLDDIILTLEFRGSTGPGAAEQPGPVLLGGSVGGSAEEALAALSLGYEDAFGTDFADASGVYSLVAPTAGAADSNSGIWFVANPSTAAPGLRGLPTAPQGWLYEGWVILRRPAGSVDVVSTGKFRRADSLDSDGPGPGNPDSLGLHAPGQDFITGPLIRPDLSSPEFAFMITLEPVPDGSLSPFPLVLLTSEDLPAAPPGQRTRPLANVTARNIPSASVSIRR